MTLLKAIEPDPKIRYRSAHEVIEALADLRLLVGDDDNDSDNDSDDNDNDNAGARSGASKRSEAVEHSQASVASEKSRPTAEPRGRASRSPAPTKRGASRNPVPAEADASGNPVPTEADASRNPAPAEGNASRNLVPIEGPTERDPRRSLWLAVLVLGLYATVDLGLHLRGYLADPPSSLDSATEISARSSPALAGDARHGHGHGRDGADDKVDADKVSAADEPTEHPEANASSDNPATADPKTKAKSQGAEEVDQPAPTNTPAADAPPAQVDAKKATNTPAQRLSRASVLKVVKPKAKELALCLRSVDADIVDAKIDISEAGSVTSVKLTPEVPYIVERCVLRILEPMTFSSALRSSSHKLPLKDA